MAYNKDIPQPSSRLRDSQSDLLENFKCISALLGVNHVIDPWQNPASGDEGKHKYLQLPNQASDPSGSIGASEVGIYCKNDATPAQQLYIKNGSSAEIPITQITSSGNERTFYTPTGLIIKTGYTTGGALTGNSWTNVSFKTAFPTALLSIQVCPVVTTVQPSDAQTTAQLILNNVFGASSKASFYVFNRRSDIGSGYAVDCTYFAIGN